jgi:hypothetical protein
VNRCGFHIIEFFNKYHPDPNGSYDEDDNRENEKDGMFRFQKKMKQTVSDT